MHPSEFVGVESLTLTLKSTRTLMELMPRIAECSDLASKEARSEHNTLIKFLIYLGCSQTQIYSFDNSIVNHTFSCNLSTYNYNGKRN